MANDVTVTMPIEKYERMKECVASCEDILKWINGEEAFVRKIGCSIIAIEAKDILDKLPYWIKEAET